MSRIERLLTAIPSFSSSPRIRSLPHAGCSRAIAAISSRASALRRARPAALPDDEDDIVVQIDVFHLEPRQLSAAQPGVDQQPKDRHVATAVEVSPFACLE
jgi:hypothetical protein